MPRSTALSEQAKPGVLLELALRADASRKQARLQYAKFLEVRRRGGRRDRREGDSCLSDQVVREGSLGGQGVRRVEGQ